VGAYNSTTMTIYSGSSNPLLAKDIALEMKAAYGETELSRFANDEARILITDAPSSREVALVQSLSNPTDHHLIEFTLMCDALKRMGAREITAIIPWMGYSKQDKVFRPGEPLSVKVIAQILQTVRLERVITFDLHNLAILGFFEVPVVNLSARALFLDYFKERISDKTIVVAPDAGSVKNSTAFAYDLHVDVAYIDKKRNLETGDVTVAGINRDITGCKVIIVDDMIVTGSTLVEVARFLKEKGAERVEVASTHHLYVAGAQEKLDDSGIDSLVVTDTVQAPRTYPHVTVLSVAGLIARELARFE
jgi:ribose-phosphate pyrophosphokinase